MTTVSHEVGSNAHKPVPVLSEDTLVVACGEIARLCGTCLDLDADGRCANPKSGRAGRNCTGSSPICTNYFHAGDEIVEMRENTSNV